MFSPSEPCSQWSYSRCQRHSWHKWKSCLVQLINLPPLIQAVLLPFVSRIVSTNTRLVFHGFPPHIHGNPPSAKSLVLLHSSSHPLALQAGNSVTLSHDLVWGIYLHEIAEVQDRQCPGSSYCMASHEQREQENKCSISYTDNVIQLKTQCSI